MSNLEIANEFIEAFYSFDKNRLAEVLKHAPAAQPNILYYQKWAECGNYEILNKNEFVQESEHVIVCPITVQDDLMPALQLDFKVTDVFRLTIIDKEIRSVENSSDDPDIYYDAKKWVHENHPELVDEQCEGIWNGGPTPCECIKGVIKGFKLFIESKSTV